MRDRDREMLAKMLVSPTSGDHVMIVPLMGWHQPDLMFPSLPSVDDTMSDYAALDFQRQHVGITTKDLTFDDVRCIWEAVVLYNEALWESAMSSLEEAKNVTDSVTK